MLYSRKKRINLSSGDIYTTWGYPVGKKRLTLLLIGQKLQSRFGVRPFKFHVVCPQEDYYYINGAVLKGLNFIFGDNLELLPYILFCSTVERHKLIFGGRMLGTTTV